MKTEYSFSLNPLLFLEVCVQTVRQLFRIFCTILDNISTFFHSGKIFFPLNANQYWQGKQLHVWRVIHSPRTRKAIHIDHESLLLNRIYQNSSYLAGWTTPADTCCLRNVVSTSKQRYDVASTFKWRCHVVKCTSSVKLVVYNHW